MRSIITILNKLWPKKIRYQMILGIALVLLLLMSLFVFDLVRRQQSFLKEQNQAQAIGLGETFAVNAGPYLLANDADALQKLVQSHINFPNLKYAMILSADGTVLAHTDEKYLGKKPNDTISLALKPLPQTQILLKNNYILDVAVPVLGTNKEIIGWARIGLGQEYIYNNLLALARNGLLYIFIAILIGSLFAFVLASRLVKGLSKLIVAADKIKSGDRNIRVSDFRSYEISKLGLAFNEMLDEISTNEDRHRALVENISDGIVLIDENWNITYQSPSVERIVGYTMEDRKGKKTIDLVYPDDLPMYLALYEKVKVSPGVPLQSQYRTRHKNGYYIWIEVVIMNLLYNKSIRSYVVIYRNITERKKFEEQQLLMSSIVNSSDDAIFSNNLDGIITSWNKGAETIFGYASEEMIGRHISTIIPSDLKGKEETILKSFLEGNSVDHYETRRLRKDGTLIDVSLTISPITDSSGNITGASKILYDITKRKKAEAELEEKENLLRLFVEHSPASLAMFDTEMRYIVVSRRWKNDYGLGDQDITGKTHYEVFPTIPQRWKDIHQRCLHGAIEKNNEDHFTAEDGSETWIKWEIHPWRKVSGEIGGIIMFTEVITEKKMMEIKLEQSEERHRALVENIDDAIVLLDENGEVIYQSPSVERILGYAPADVKNKKVFEFVHPDHMQFVFEIFQRSAASPGLPISESFQMLHKEGRHIWIEGVIANFLHLTSVKGFIVSFRDITERKRAETAILHEKNLSDTIIRGLPGLFYIANKNDGKMIRWNKNIETITGYNYTEISTMHTADFADKDQIELILSKRQEAFSTGRASAEINIITKQKQKLVFYITIMPVGFNGQECILGMGVDITEKKKAEAELRKINHDIGERVKELRCLYRMSELSNNLAKTMEDILQECADIIPPSYQYPEITCARILFGGQKYESKDFIETAWKQEAGINTANSNIGKVEVYYSRQMPDEQEGPFLKEERFLINSIADILGSSAERRKGEQEILRLNRLYQFISQINESMLKLESRNAIYFEACRIAVEYGNFRMAWIGFTDDKEERVMPYAVAGYDEGYLESIKIVSDNFKITGRGPTGKAIRSKTYQYCNDIANDPAMYPWREEAIKRNYRSSISLPVIVNTELVAVYTLYMSEPFFFNEAEIKLLLEVTDNIAYALDKIRLAELHNKAEMELKESEEKFRSLVEQNLVGVYILQDGKLKYVNPGFVGAIGYTKDELLNKVSFADLIHEEDQEMVRKNYLLRVSGENPPHQYVFRAIKKDASLLYLEVIASTIIYEGKPAVIGTLVDITSRVEEEKRIGKAVNDAQERERMQIGMELHDNVKQIMAASLMSLDFVKQSLNDKKKATETVDNIKGYIREAIDELRRLSHQLAPSINTDDTLAEKIEKLVNTMNTGNQLQVTVDVDEFEQPIHSDIQTAFYRILQEQFNNILKYANASSVLVSIKLNRNNIYLAIKDDGQGFDTNTKKDGIGLENIKRRAQVLGGHVKIISSPGKGCEVNVQIPLKQS